VPLGVFTSVGLILVAVGVYSVIAYTVSRQTREVGIRMALGAERGGVLWVVSSICMRLIAIDGGGVGLLASFAALRVIEGQPVRRLFARSAHAARRLRLMGLVGAAACYVPANKAARVDPDVALRVD
jgi:putative ABC transport system permease protein